MGEIKLRQYSQSSLQDYADCKRRFYYRFLTQLTWPAVESEPVTAAEQHRRAGEQFHLMARQYLSGLPEDEVAKFASSSDLRTWWENFKGSDFNLDEAVIYPERVLTAKIGGFKLSAKYDLLAVFPDGRVVIFDWKTSRFQPSRVNLANRWQTILYPCLLVTSGSLVNQGKEIVSDNVLMVYWFANYPTSPISFQYSDEDKKRDEEAIVSLIKDIESRNSIDDFELTEDEQRCKYCVYRSLCERGISAGEEHWVEFDADEEIDLDFEQIQEIEF